jgi:hypothetical protein
VPATGHATQQDPPMVWQAFIEVIDIAAVLNLFEDVCVDTILPLDV